MNPRIAPTHSVADSSCCEETRASADTRSLRDMMCVFGERMKHGATRTEVNALATRVAVLEERLSHTATKTWVLGGVAAVLAGLFSGLWWIVQQYLSPLLHALPHT